MNYVCLSKFSYLRTSYFLLESWKQVCNELYLYGCIREWDFFLSSQSLSGLSVIPITCRFNAYSLIKVGCGFVFFFLLHLWEGYWVQRWFCFYLNFPNTYQGWIQNWISWDLRAYSKIKKLPTQLDSFDTCSQQNK